MLQRHAFVSSRSKNHALSSQMESSNEQKKKKERTKTLTIPNVFDVHSHNERGGARWDEVRWVIWLADVSPVPATTPHTTHVTLRNFKIHSCIEWSVQQNTATATFRMYSKRFSFTFSCCCCCLFVFCLICLLAQLQSWFSYQYIGNLKTIESNAWATKQKTVTTRIWKRIPFEMGKWKTENRAQHSK